MLMTQVSRMPLSKDGSLVIFASFQAEGIVPSSSDCWKREARIGANWDADSLRTRAGI